jgi:hypothetical protein
VYKCIANWFVDFLKDKEDENADEEASSSTSEIVIKDLNEDLLMNYTEDVYDEEEKPPFNNLNDRDWNSGEEEACGMEEAVEEDWEEETHVHGVKDYDVEIKEEDVEDNKADKPHVSVEVESVWRHS